MRKLNTDYQYDVTGNELIKIKSTKHGRPAKEEKNKLKHKVTLSFTDEEFNNLTKEAGLVPLSIYLKYKIIK